MLTIKFIDSSRLMWKKEYITMKLPLPVPAVAMSKLRAMSCVLTSPKTSRFTAQISSEKNKIKI
jgi:hypothetical protein